MVGIEFPVRQAERVAGEKSTAARVENADVMPRMTGRVDA